MHGCLHAGGGYVACTCRAGLCVCSWRPADAPGPASSITLHYKTFDVHGVQQDSLDKRPPVPRQCSNTAARAATLLRSFPSPDCGRFCLTVCFVLYNRYSNRCRSSPSNLPPPPTTCCSSCSACPPSWRQVGAARRARASGTACRARQEHTQSAEEREGMAAAAALFLLRF